VRSRWRGRARGGGGRGDGGSGHDGRAPSPLWRKGTSVALPWSAPAAEEGRGSGVICVCPPAWERPAAAKPSLPNVGRDHRSIVCAGRSGPSRAASSFSSSSFRSPPGN